MWTGHLSLAFVFCVTLLWSFREICINNMNNWKTHYNKDWENETLYPNISKWVRTIANKPTSAACKFCPALEVLLISVTWVCKPSRAIQNKKKHEKARKLVGSSTPIAYFQKQASKTNTNLKGSATLSGQSGTLQSVIDTNLMKDASVAEVLWALKSVVSHHSFRGCNGLSDLFAKMFPDSNVAKQFSVAWTKLSCYMLWTSTILQKQNNTEFIPKFLYKTAFCCIIWQSI